MAVSRPVCCGLCVQWVVCLVMCGTDVIADRPVRFLSLTRVEDD